MNNKMIYLLLADYPYLRNLIYRETKTNLYKKFKLTKEVREDIEKIRLNMNIREENNTRDDVYVVEE